MIIFRNTNEPEQPCRGVYRWYVEASGSEVFTLYVGEAGARKPRSLRKPSTLSRGISEAQLGSVSSDKGSSIDTDFIVGAAIQYLTDKGFKCVWEHIDNEPSHERDLCKKHKPRLQNHETGEIDSKRRLKRCKGTWSAKTAAQAFGELQKQFANMGLHLDAATGRE